MPPINDRVLCILHLAAGVGLILVATILSATGHTGSLLDAAFGAGAVLLPTAPSALLKSKGTLISDTAAAIAQATAKTQVPGA